MRVRIVGVISHEPGPGFEMVYQKTTMQKKINGPTLKLYRRKRMLF